MHVTELPGYRWSEGREPPNWGSGLVAIAATALLFASAFLAMTRVRELRERATVATVTPPAVVHLPVPVPVPQPKPAVEPVPRRTTPATTPFPVRAPAPSVAQPSPGQPSVAQPVTGAPGVPRSDSAATARAAADAAQSLYLRELHQPVLHVPPAPRTLGTPPEPAGVAIHNKKLTLGDMEAGLAALNQAMRLAPETPAEREANNRGSHPPPLQNGPAADMRRGMVNVPMGSISVPFLSPGLSPEQRKRNAVIDSEYQWRLWRLEDRAGLVRDSVRADSLRRDSLAKAKRKP